MGGAHSSLPCQRVKRHRDRQQSNYKQGFCQRIILCAIHTAYVCFIKSTFLQLPNTVLVIMSQQHGGDHISR